VRSNFLILAFAPLSSCLARDFEERNYRPLCSKGSEFGGLDSVLCQRPTLSEFTGGVNPYFETALLGTLPKRLLREQVLLVWPPA
jgi:hypothetical protein